VRENISGAWRKVQFGEILLFIQSYAHKSRERSHKVRKRTFSHILVYSKLVHEMQVLKRLLTALLKITTTSPNILLDNIFEVPVKSSFCK
jgi:hypothetical protein